MCMFFYCYTFLTGFSFQYFYLITRDISHWYRLTLICHFSPNVFKFWLSHLIIKIKFFLFNLNEIAGFDVLFLLEKSSRKIENVWAYFTIFHLINCPIQLIVNINVLTSRMKDKTVDLLMIFKSGWQSVKKMFSITLINRLVRLCG